MNYVDSLENLIGQKISIVITDKIYFLTDSHVYWFTGTDFEIDKLSGGVVESINKEYMGDKIYFSLMIGSSACMIKFNSESYLVYDQWEQNYEHLY